MLLVDVHGLANSLLCIFLWTVSRDCYSCEADEGERLVVLHFGKHDHHWE